MNDTWIVRETAFEPQKLHHQETVFTIGNGYLGTRGAFEEGYPGEWRATFIHGIFDDVPIVHTELANCPDWLALTVAVAGERFRLDRGEVLRYERQLDLRHGVLRREVRWRSPAGHTLELHFERFASLADPHLLVVRCRITPLDFDGPIAVQAGLNGYPDNLGVAHWWVLDQGADPQRVWLGVRTRHTGLTVGMAAALRVDDTSSLRCQGLNCDGVPTLVAEWNAQRNVPVTVTKLVTVYTSRDLEPPEKGEGRDGGVVDVAREKLEALLRRAADYDDLLEAHKAAWERVWAVSDIQIEGDDVAQRAVRYNLFQLLIAAPWWDDRVSIPAKTLSGFGYRGHVFWDTDVFILPMFIWTHPDVARHMLLYRYHTLPGARRKAAAEGYPGALYPWESALTGDEVTPRWVPVPDQKELLRIWTGDLELHINADVAYAAWQYWQVTGDDEFMLRYGAEIILDTAVFWGARAEWHPETGRYEIRDVIGPDEYHEHVDNNAFTNGMVRWHLETALQVLDWLEAQHPQQATQLRQRLNLDAPRLARWRDVIAKLYVPHDPQTKRIEQFDGYFRLRDVDLAAYEPRERSMQAILGIEGVQETQVIKQPDVLMLLHLLGDAYDLETLRANWAYYAPRTDHTHGSSLGPAIHAVLACRLGDPETAYEHFMRAALVDLEDTRGNTADGVHAASAGGLWQAVVFGFGGVRLTPHGPVAEPRLPPGWRRLGFRLRYRGKEYSFDLTPEE